MLIVIVIISILAIYLLGGPGMFGNNDTGTDPKSEPTGISGGVGGAIGARNKALDTTCRNNLQQLRTAIQIASSYNEGYWPDNLESVAQSNPGVKIACPVGDEPYQYDSSTGKVWCVHPGHERF